MSDEIFETKSLTVAFKSAPMFEVSIPLFLVASLTSLYTKRGCLFVPSKNVSECAVTIVGAATPFSGKSKTL